jgi:hypothetical protein
LWGHRWLGCENFAKGESIAQRPRRSQRWIGGRPGTFGRGHVGLGARISRKGKASHRGHGGYRGGIAVRPGRFGRGHRWPGCENLAKKGKASHRGHGGHRGGIGLGRGTLAGDTVGLGARISRQGKGSMISPLRVAAARMARIESQALRAFRNSCRCPPNKINARPEFPSVTSVRCFPLFAGSCTEAAVSPRLFSRELFLLTDAWEKVPQSLVHSQSAILGSHKTSLVSHRSLDILERVGGTGQEMGVIKG